MRPSRIPLPAPLRSTPVTALRRYYERSDSCAGGSSALASMNTVLTPAQVSLRPVPRRHDHSVSTHLTCPRRRFRTLPLSARRSPRRRRLRLRLSPAGSSRHARPNRVRHPTDWSFTSGCSPPRLAATQLPLVTGRRAYAWRGLAPLCRGTIAGARALLSVMAPLQAHRHRASRGRGGTRRSGITSTCWCFGACDPDLPVPAIAASAGPAAWRRPPVAC